MVEQVPEGFSQHYFDTTIINNNQAYRITTRDLDENFVLLVATTEAKTALADTLAGGGLANIQFPDFNRDGNSDIMLSYMGNNSTHSLYLFDPKSTMFKNIEGFEKFPEAIQLKSNPAYYYSYKRAGCADLNWVSNLFKIEDFKAIKLGHIYGQGCDSEEKEYPQVIDVYKVKSNREEKKILVEKLPYLEYIADFADKWGLIEKYWNEKYRNFE